MKHEYFLKRCLDLAKLGESRTFPNPIVGCVIVNDQEEIIGEGFHEYFGGPHAEVVAIDNALETNKTESSKLKAQSSNLKSLEPSALSLQLFSEHTIYISLEPCSHHGKTPPCTDLIIRHKFKRVVYACSDPNPLVAGKGIQKIKDAGIEVVGPSELDTEIVREAEFVNRQFFHIIQKSSKLKAESSKLESNSFEPSALSIEHPCWITLKIALTVDGSMISYERFISNTNARKDVHHLRSTHQLLITGINTIKIDNPFLNVRYSPEELGLQEIKDPNILILNDQQFISKHEESELNIFKITDRKIYFEKLTQDFNNLRELIDKYASMGYQKIMIEAGPTLSKAFLDSRLVDELIVYTPSSNAERTLKKFYKNDFTLMKLSTIEGAKNEKNNLKAIFC